jgi:hypothetical protein
LGRKQEALLAALLTEPTLARAAAKAGVSEATVHRWLLLPEFQAAYRRARRQIVEAAIGQLQQATGEAVETLRRNLTCGHAGAEIRAAAAILDQAIRGLELVDLEERLAALENADAKGEDGDDP